MRPFRIALHAGAAQQSAPAAVKSRRVAANATLRHHHFRGHASSFSLVSSVLSAKRAFATTCLTDVRSSLGVVRP